MREKGFTLLELLIAITILSLIAVIIGAGIRLGIRAWERGEADNDNSQKIRYFSERFSRQVKSVYPYQIEIDGEKAIAFKGKSDSIFFVTSSVAHSEGGLKWIAYFLKDDNLIVQEGDLPDKKVMEKVFKEGEIFDSGVSELKFEYFSSKDKEWKKSWDSKTDLPGAVKISSDSLPSMVIAIPLGLKDEKK
ncbi:MAG: prepilin-type N-terminal cleavage/methylation domain-containing protein [Nitrospirae bacterium]|nr:prepilin-type N-terminal cleavage/methylation domain-containing protein [Nitrospirota bacterium]